MITVGTTKYDFFRSQFKTLARVAFLPYSNTFDNILQVRIVYLYIYIHVAQTTRINGRTVIWRPPPPTLFALGQPAGRIIVIVALYTSEK